MKIVWLMFFLSPFCNLALFAQISPADDQPETTQASLSVPQSGNGQPSETPPQLGVAAQTASQPLEEQPKRILWIVPNFRSVSANKQLPPLSRRGKLWLATQDSFDYSSVILAAIVAAASQAQGSSPEFDDGAAAYGRYLWRTFTDEAVANYFTEVFLPIATHEDPRYYTLGRGANFLHRTGYAFTRLVITRTDSGGSTFNFSEVAGNALGARFPIFTIPRRSALGVKRGKSGESNWESTRFSMWPRNFGRTLTSASSAVNTALIALSDQV